MVKITYLPPDTYLAATPKKQTTTIDQLLSEKVQCLATILQDIQSKIDKRSALSCEVHGLIDQHYRYIKTKFFELERWPIGGIRAVEQRRSGLEQMLDTLQNEKRREQVQCWQDIADLKKEFWKWFREYCEVVQRVRILDRGQA